jgi:hypothetical protein
VLIGLDCPARSALPTPKAIPQSRRRRIKTLERLSGLRPGLRIGFACLAALRAKRSIRDNHFQEVCLAHVGVRLFEEQEGSVQLFVLRPHLQEGFVSYSALRARQSGAATNLLRPLAAKNGVRSSDIGKWRSAR